MSLYCDENICITLNTIILYLGYFIVFTLMPFNEYQICEDSNQTTETETVTD